MLSTRHTQSLTEFRQRANETLDRLNQTGEAEILTVNGEARAVLISPAAYDELAKELQLANDVVSIRRAMEEIREGKARTVDAVFDDLRAKLMKMKSKRRGVSK